MKDAQHGKITLNQWWCLHRYSILLGKTIMGGLSHQMGMRAVDFFIQSLLQPFKCNNYSTTLVLLTTPVQPLDNHYSKN